MSRVVVLGAGGFFGSTAVQMLRGRGLTCLTPARREADADDVEALRRYLRPGDVVLDAAGPFQARTLALVDAAAAVGADVVDLNDSLDYAERVLALAGRVEVAGVRLLSSCSSVSAVTAAMVLASGVTDPRAVAVCLSPASGETSTRGTAASVIATVGAPVRRRRYGRLQTERGWSRHRDFDAPDLGGRVRGYLAESADAVTLPLAWPGLADVDFWVNANASGINGLIRALAVVPGSGRWVEPLAPMGVRLARRLGSHRGGVALEMHGDDGRAWSGALTAPARSYLVAVLPAVLAVESILGGRMPTGLVPVHRQVDPGELFDGLSRLGITVSLG